MDTLKQAMLKAFPDLDRAKTAEAKREWFYKNGLSSVLPVKQVKLHLGVTRLKTGVTVMQEAYVTVGRNS